MPPSSQAAYQSLQAFKPREAKDVMGEAEAKYDITGKKDRLSSLRGLVGNLQSSVEAVDPSVTARTSGTFTTEGQRSALVNRERQPILGSLAKEQQALGIEQQGFAESQNLATQMASALMNQDQTTYQRLLDQYNASLASEQAAEAKRQYEATMAEQRRQFDEQQKAARAAASGGRYTIDPNLVNNPPAKTTNTSSAVNPLLQDAYSEVVKRFEQQSPTDVIGDYVSTYRGFQAGNERDRLKLQLYAKEFAKKLPGWLSDPKTKVAIAKKIASESGEGQKFLKSNLGSASIPLSFVSSNKVTF